MKRIVVAESSPTIKNVADNLLRQNGYNVVCTSDGLQAWEVVKSEKPDLILVGPNLSGISGLELCRQMSGDPTVSAVPVVFMLGAKDNIDENQLKSSGVRGKLNKPFSPRDLLNAVERIIGAGEKTSGNRSGQGSQNTNYKAEVMSTTSHLKDSSKMVYNLDWTDLNDTAQGEVGVSVDQPDMIVPENEDEITIDHNQFDLESLNADDEDQPVLETAESDDEDYDWFIGEMKKDDKSGKTPEGGKKPQARKTEGVSHKAPPPESGMSSDGGELKFEDFGPTEKNDFQPEAKINSAKPAVENQKSGSTAIGERELNDTEISEIAERVAGKLASALAAKIDMQTILDAIRSEMKQ